MKRSPEEKEAISYLKEYTMLNKYALREGAPAVEREYFSRMAAHTNSFIDYSQINKKKKTEEEKATYYDFNN